MNTSLISPLIVLWSHIAIEQTLEALGDPELMRALRRSIQGVAQGEMIPWEDAREKIVL